MHIHRNSVLDPEAVLGEHFLPEPVVVAYQYQQRVSQYHSSMLDVNEGET